MSEDHGMKSHSPNINLQDIADIDHFEAQQALAIIVERQIEDLEDLDHNLLDDDGQLDNSTLADVLMYVNSNYITIPYIETIVVDPNTVDKVGKFTYELFVVELLNFIVPKMLLALDLKDPVELPMVNYAGFKSTLKDVTLARLESIRKMYTISGNEELYTLVLKWTFYYDLFDGNLENFIERVISILVNTHGTKITSKMIDI